MPSLRYIVLTVGLLSFAPAAAAQNNWHHGVLADHPLVGKIWSNRDRQFVDMGSLVSAATAAKYLLLGEKHDNLDHHRLQAMVTEAMYRSGRRPALAFEMIETDKQADIDAFLAENPTDAGELGDRIGWKNSGWGPWARYRSIADAAVSAGASIVAANLPRSRNRSVARQGFSVLDKELVRRTGLDTPFPDRLQTDLEAEITVAHCGQIPASAVPAVARVQRARDAVMAERMTSASPGGGAILITGAGHARADRGVPYYLRVIEPTAIVISIGFREVTAGTQSVSEYEDTSPFDFIWFTPRVDNDDPCEKFKSQLRKMNGKSD